MQYSDSVPLQTLAQTDGTDGKGKWLTQGGPFVQLSQEKNQKVKHKKSAPATKVNVHASSPPSLASWLCSRRPPPLRAPPRTALLAQMKTLGLRGIRAEGLMPARWVWGCEKGLGSRARSSRAVLPPSRVPAAGARCCPPAAGAALELGAPPADDARAWGAPGSLQGTSSATGKGRNVREICLSDTGRRGG